ncbi:MAG: pilin [bacterium]|nr:pilin [bacterium]
MNDFLKIVAQTIDPGRLDIPQGDTINNSNVDDMLQIVFAIVGAIAFLIIVLAGLKYTLSQGNPQETAKAKNQIVYALVGMVIALLAFSIVRFVVKEI